MDYSIRGPGPGWSQLTGTVWERADGLRVHRGGLIRFPNGTIINGFESPLERARAEDLQTLSRMRMLMTWAHLVAGPPTPKERTP